MLRNSEAFTFKIESRVACNKQSFSFLLPTHWKISAFRVHIVYKEETHLSHYSRLLIIIDTTVTRIRVLYYIILHK